MVFLVFSGGLTMKKVIDVFICMFLILLLLGLLDMWNSDHLFLYLI